MKIVIPTYMREDRQVAYNSLPDDIKPLVTLVTHSGRADILCQANPTAAVVDLGNCDGIADVRQKLLCAFPDNHVMIIDDQCRFKKRTSDMKYAPMESSDYKELFSIVDTSLQKYGMVGVSDRGGNNRILEATKEVARMYSVLAVNQKIWRENNIRFDGMYQKNKEIKLYEDFYAILKMLTSGLPNLLIANYVFETPHGKPGGNSTFRTTETQKNCLMALQSEFPEFVKVEWKENTSWTTGEEKGRWEARISWQSAFESSTKSSDASLEEFFG